MSGKQQRSAKQRPTRPSQRDPSPEPSGRAFQRAHQLHQQGQLEAARQLYTDILAENPRHADAWHLLGVVMYQGSQFDAALECLEQANQLSPCNPDLLSNLGLVYRALQKLDLARDALSQAVAFKANFVTALANLGTVLLELHEHREAEQRLRQALALQPDHPAALSTLGNALQSQQRLHEAEACYQRVLELHPSDTAALNNWASCLIGMRRWAEAIPTLQQAIAGGTIAAEAQINLAKCLIGIDQPDAAIDCLENLLSRLPQSPQAHHYLGQAFDLQGQHQRAVDSFQKAIQLDPGYAHAHASLGLSLLRCGDLPQAIASHRTALKLRPDFHDTHSELLFLLSGDASVSPQQLFQEHCRWAEVHAAVMPLAPSFANVPDPARRLRLGYVSPDFRSHALATYIEPILANHRPQEVETYCYSNVFEDDETTNRLRQLVDHWRPTRGYSDLQVAEMVRSDQIDVLVDLAGHTAGHRLRSFAYRPAPVQATWLGYPNSTGLPAIDYFLTNKIQNADGQPCHAERLVYLEIDTCFLPPPDAPDVRPPPSERNGYLTLGALHRHQKLTLQVFDLWAQILDSLPTARLLLYNTSFTGDVQAHTRRELVARGVDGERVSIECATDQPSYLHLYHDIDIGLDVFPWNGGTTNREAMWLGVPVIGLYGDRSSSRSTAAALHQLGLPELVAHSPSEYVAIVQRLGSSTDELATLRGSLRDRMRATLCNGPLVTENLELAYRQMWRDWCAEKSEVAS